MAEVCRTVIYLRQAMANINNTSPTPVGQDARVFTGFSHASLWFSLGVGLLVMQVGAYLVPAMGTLDALTAIAIGSILGSALLAAAAKLGCDSGLSSAGLMHRVYGSAFARLTDVIKIEQLIGWTAFELVVMRDGTNAIGERAFGVQLNIIWPTLLWGGVLTLLMMGSMLTLVRQFVSRIGLPLVIGSHAFSHRFGHGHACVLVAIGRRLRSPWPQRTQHFCRHLDGLCHRQCLVLRLGVFGRQRI